MERLARGVLLCFVLLMSTAVAFGQCPTVTLDAPATVGISEATPFTLKVSGAAVAAKPRVVWLSTQGEIVKRSDDGLTAWVGTRDLTIGTRFVVTTSVSFTGCETVYFNSTPAVGLPTSKPVCPAASIKNAGYTLPGLALVLTAGVEGAVPGREPSYTWRFSPSIGSAGESGGQTSVIPEGALPSGSTVKVEVDVSGFAGCKVTGRASFTLPGNAVAAAPNKSPEIPKPAPAEQASPVSKVEADTIDHFNPIELKWTTQQQRMDTDAATLAENPAAQLQLVFYTAPGHSKKDLIAAATRAMDYIKKLLRTKHKSNPDRITIVDGGSHESRPFLEFWLVPEGAKPFTPGSQK
jgi:hypothetical protein